MKLGIFFRSTAGYLIVLLLLGASNVYAILKLVQFNTAILDTVDANIRILDLEKKLVDSLLSQQRYEQKYMLTMDIALYNQFLTASDDFTRYLREISSLSLPPAKRNFFANIRVLHQNYHALVDAEIINLGARRDYDKNGYRREKEKALDVVVRELEKIEDDSREDIVNKTKKISEAGTSARLVAVASLLFTVLVAIILSFFITRSITRPLFKLVNKTKEIPKGFFDCDLDLSAPPEIMALAEAFTLMCDRLKEVDKMKTDFFSMISHELRTPLTTIREGTSLLLEGAGGSFTEKQGRLLSIIAAESSRLTGLVNSILDLSKMEAGMIMYTFEQNDMVPLIERAMTEITPYIEAKSITLEKQLATDLPPSRMDSERILEVLRNLIGNAVKFTPEGGRITIAVRSTRDGLEVSVRDTGVGILKENLATIFEKYASSDQKKGTGLGLAIVKHIVAAHGGKVWAESEPGRGSRFIFLLPS